MADLLGPEIVLRHIRKPPKRPDPYRTRDPPAGLLEDLAVERCDRAFARVDPAAR